MTTQTQHPGGVMPRGWHLPHIPISALVIFGLALVLLLLAISAASQAFAPQAARNALNLTEPDTGKQVTLKSGETLGVSLSGNPTTGYQWMLESTNQTVLKPLGEPAYTADSALIGSGGTYSWCFSAVAAGQTPLRLVYRRAWEEYTPPLRTFEINVLVK